MKPDNTKLNKMDDNYLFNTIGSFENNQTRTKRDIDYLYLLLAERDMRTRKRYGRSIRFKIELNNIEREARKDD